MGVLEFFTILERDHTYQNPTSAEKLDQLIEHCALEDGHHVLDVGCGKGWLLQRIAERWAVAADGIEPNPAFVEEGRERLRRAPLRGEVTFHEMPARAFSGEPGVYDVGLCIGASFAIGTFDEMLAWLRPYVRPGGVIAVGDIYARSGPVPAEAVAHFAGGPVRTLADTVSRLNRDGLTLTALIDSSLDDWDRYESLHWRAAESWARRNPDHPELREFWERSERLKTNHLEFDRGSLGWALFVSRVSASEGT